MSAQSQPSYPGTFVRRASGLVRTAGPLDVLAYNIQCLHNHSHRTQEPSFVGLPD